MTVEMKKTILIVEDEPDILNLTSKFLKLGDFDTIACNNIDEALRLLEERYKDITIIILNPMPELKKKEFLQSINSDDRYKHIKVIFTRTDDNRDLPFPYVFKPPKPPDDLALAGEPQAKELIIMEDVEHFCKHCGAELPKGQTICHACGKKVK